MCWHDFALGMFGICDGQGYPRPAILAFAGLASRLDGATPAARPRFEGGLHGYRFRRGSRDVLALWTERGVEFAALKPPGALAATLYDAYGNARPLAIPAEGAALPATESIEYLEAPSLGQVALSRVQPIRIQPDTLELVAGHQDTLTCRIENVFAGGPSFRVEVGSPAGLTAQTPGQEARIAPRQSGSVPLLLRADRDAQPGERAAPIRVTLPGGMTVDFEARVRVLAPLSLAVEPFDTGTLGKAPADTAVLVRNNDDRPVSGEVTLSGPAGGTMTPAVVRFADVPPGEVAKLPVTVACAGAPGSGDALRLRATTADGARVEARRSLKPVVLDADGNGLADGWRINPENTGQPEQRNVAEVSVEPGDTEFLCQRVHCTRFTSGWIILHRDGQDPQDPIVKGKRYRITFRARQRGIMGTVGLAVYNIQPWQGCGIESQFRVGPDWQDFTYTFTATRDSDNVRFEFFFTETGTVWIEGMRLEGTEP